jgi:hypothetical protein
MRGDKCPPQRLTEGDKVSLHPVKNCLSRQFFMAWSWGGKKEKEKEK